MAEQGPLFAVTTRSRLRSPARFPAMLLATRRIRQQLADDGDVVRWASVVAGPTELWTLTVWRSRHDMQEFMRSGAHDEIMWLFSRWLESFWLMRWKPGQVEGGSWHGLTMGSVAAAENPVGTRSDALAQALAHLPRLAAAVSADGVARFEATPYARRRQAEVGRARGLVMQLRGRPWQTASVLRALRRIARIARADPRLLRTVVGVGRAGEAYLLAVSVDEGGIHDLLADASVVGALGAWPDHWVNEWLPENEFGHWDGLRVRRSAANPRIAVPAVFDS